MAADFNPYHVWLGIPPEEQPANHYRLLSLRLFETNGDVIDNAADRQMAHLRTIQVGKHGELSQRLLNEVAAARVCLLDPKKRAAYDQQLRAKLPAASPAIGIAVQPAKAVAPLPRAVATSPAGDHWDELLGGAAANPTQTAGSKSANSPKTIAAKQTDKNRMISIGVAVGVVLIAAVAFGVYSLNSPSEGTLVFDWPDRTDVAVTVDGAPIAVPASGSWEHNFPAGPHRIAAQRPAFKLGAEVNLTAGQRLDVPADWKAKATLVLNWPVAERAGADLKIDGRPQTIAQHDPLELPVDPGRHRIDVARPNVAPFFTTATVAADQREIVAVTRPPKEAKLVLDWSVEQRKGAVLTIDGRAVTTSDAEPFELKLEPGRHVVRIFRRDFETFAQNVELSEGTNDPLKPTWTPEQKTATAPTVAETTVPVETTAPQQAKKLPIPAVAEQEKIAKQLNDLYKTSQPGPKDPAKAQELYDVAAKDGSSPAERYMLLIKGAEIAAAAGDLSLSMQGIDALDADYEIDAFDLKQKLLDKFVAAGKPDQVAIAIPTAEQLVDQAVAADRFDIAVVLATSASKAVAKSKIATRKEVEERLARRRHDIHLIEPIYAAAKKARETLEKTPTNPEANLNVGRWLCFYKGDWTTGLPMLARGNDEKLKALSEQEIKSPTDADQQVQLADVWWDLAQKEAGIARDSLHLHAGNIYEAAMPNLASALKKAAIEKRLAEIADLKPIAAAAGASKSIDAFKFPLGRWVDVLSLIDPPRDQVDGTWVRSGAGLSVEAGDHYSRIAIPVDIDGGYDLGIEFTRTSERDDVNTMVSIGSHAVMVMLSGNGGEVSGLMRVNDRDPFDSLNPITTKPGSLENGHRYQLYIKARMLRNDRASIDVALDGKPYLPHWEGERSDLSYHPAWALPNSKRLGLGAYRGAVTFHTVRLKMISGRASVDASAVESAPPQVASATATTEKPIGAVKLPLGKGIDLLANVDVKRDSIEGQWERHGSTIVCNGSTSVGDRRFLVFPTEIAEAHYELRVEFSRDSGDNCFAVSFPVGDRGAEFILADDHSKFSGLEVIDGHRLDDTDNPTARSPSTLENGRRYVVRIVVNVERDTAKVNCFLDGDELVAWKGKVDSLVQYGPWKIDPHRAAVGEWNSPSTIYGATVRALK